MNCRSFHKRLADMLDACPDPGANEDLLEHAAECSKCARELREARTVMARITPSQRLHASSQVKERIMDSINELDTAQRAARPARIPRPRYLRLVRAGVLAAILLLAVIAAGQFVGRPSPAFAAFAQAAEFVRGVKTMHISARMRTLPGDTFDCIKLDAPLIPVEMWTQCGNPPKVRVDKQLRRIVVDGISTIILIEPGGGTAVAAKLEGVYLGNFGWLSPLADPDTLFEREQRATEDEDASVTVTEGTFNLDGKNIGRKTILTVNAKAQGDFSESGYRRNKSILESDNTRVYVFDPDTHRLECLQVFVKTERGSVLVFETTKIEYDIPLSPSVFHLQVPKNAVWYKPPSEVGTTVDTSSMQPDEVAREFLEAISRSDWQGVRQFAGSLLDAPKFRNYLGGLQVISVGKPFKSGTYPGWFVPFEARLKSGKVMKSQINFRNDNPKSQWMWDGGF